MWLPRIGHQTLLWLPIKRGVGGGKLKIPKNYYCSHSSLFYRERVNEVPTNEIIEYRDKHFGYKMLAPENTSKFYKCNNNG